MLSTVRLRALCKVASQCLLLSGFVSLTSVFSFQPGIISRVTESVKNIVPGWLQKYFKKREDECIDTDESTNQEENPVDYHHDYANEDTMVIDGRVTPESARINLDGMWKSI